MSIKATRFVSEQPQTPFAPVWDYTLAQEQIDIDLESLRDLILLKEQEIIKEFPGDKADLQLNDGYTGLGPDSLTARFKYFNVLKWDHPECKKLHIAIKQLHDAYHVGLVGENIPKLKIQCWANVLRKGESIGKHNHAIHPHTYLSGHFCVACENTSTFYIPPYTEWGNEIDMKNIPGEMTLFPTWLTHYTSVNESDSPRITLAFDIIPFGHESSSFEDNLIEL